MPDVKHVGGYGPLLDVCTMAADHGVEVSPHNPDGLFATAASLHCAAMRPAVRYLELAFDPDCMRSKYVEIIQYGQMALGQAPGWGGKPGIIGPPRLSPWQKKIVAGTKLLEMVQFMFTVEAREADEER